MYFIQNISDRDAKLFFAQARKMPEMEDVDADRELASTSRSPSKERRSESVPKRAASEVNGTTAKAKKRAASRA